MARFIPAEELFKGRHFDQEIVVLCVRWYLSFKLSYRDLVAIPPRATPWLTEREYSYFKTSRSGCLSAPKDHRRRYAELQ